MSHWKQIWLSLVELHQRDIIHSSLYSFLKINTNDPMKIPVTIFMKWIKVNEIKIAYLLYKNGVTDTWIHIELYL